MSKSLASVLGILWVAGAVTAGSPASAQEPVPPLDPVVAHPSTVRVEGTAPAKRTGDGAMIAGGALLFALGYVPALAIGMSGAQGGQPLALLTAVPVFGPCGIGFAALAASGAGGSWGDALKAMGAIYLVDGVMQAVGVVLLTAGILSTPTKKDAPTGVRVTSLGVANSTLVVGGTF